MARALAAALFAMLGWPAASFAAAPAAGQPHAPKALHGAAFEAAPAVVGQGRFRMSARLQPASASALEARSGELKLGAALVPKGTAASCPVPGKIFADGFELP